MISYHHIGVVCGLQIHTEALTNTYQYPIYTHETYAQIYIPKQWDFYNPEIENLWSSSQNWGSGQIEWALYKGLGLMLSVEMLDK